MDWLRFETPESAKGCHRREIKPKKGGRGRKRMTLYDHWRRKENNRTETFYGEIKRRAEDRDGWHV